MPVNITNTQRHASDLLDLLVDVGPITGAAACVKLGWPRGRFDTALRFAREQLCPELGLTIPAAIPPDWRYQVTTEWQPVEAGTAYTLGHVDARLVSVLRDVDTILPHLTPRSREWNRARFLSKHLSHIIGTLTEIDGRG
jgi:hypothetical protein